MKWMNYFSFFLWVLGSFFLKSMVLAQDKIQDKLQDKQGLSGGNTYEGNTYEKIVETPDSRHWARIFVDALNENIRSEALPHPVIDEIARGIFFSISSKIWIDRLKAQEFWMALREFGYPIPGNLSIQALREWLTLFYRVKSGRYTAQDGGVSRDHASFRDVPTLFNEWPVLRKAYDNELQVFPNDASRATAAAALRVFDDQSFVSWADSGQSAEPTRLVESKKKACSLVMADQAQHKKLKKPKQTKPRSPRKKG